MLSFRVYARLHPRRFVSPLRRDLCGQRLTRACRGVAAYAEPLEGRQTVLSSFIFQPLNFQLLTFNFPLSLPPLSPLSATFTRLPASVANKRLTAKLNPLDATLTRNRGWGPVIGRRFSRADANSERKKEKEQKEGRTEARPYRERSDG